jgi:hypothetical protein
MPKRKYRVTSRANTLSRPKGTVFEADLAKLGYNEADLIDRGALERVSDSTKTEKGEPGPRAPIQGVKGVVSASDTEESDSSDSSKS